jgi:nickel-dependent lactate racemase
LANSKLVSLAYGYEGRFSCEIDAGRMVASPEPPQPNEAYRDELRMALAQPLDYPPLGKALIPGDKVTLALDRGVPESAGLIAETWGVLAEREIAPEDVTIVQPAGRRGDRSTDPRSKLPASVRKEMKWVVHDPNDSARCGYLATTASGERIYLAREVIDADVVISIGCISYDPVVGFRGTNSVFYPSLSTAEAIAKTRGLGHRELDPEDFRPLRQTMDEIGWLLGTQFTVQVVPSAGGGVARILAGTSEAVLREGRRILTDRWLVRLESRADIVVVAVDNDAAGHGWEQFAAALATARSLVAMGGKILVLTEVDAELGDGFQLLTRYDTPRDAMQPLRDLAPDDFSEAAQLAYTADWARIYLMSKLNPDVVEELFMVPVANEREASRLLSGDETCLFVGSAQFTFGAING